MRLISLIWHAHLHSSTEPGRDPNLPAFPQPFGKVERLKSSQDGILAGQPQHFQGATPQPRLGNTDTRFRHQ